MVCILRFVCVNIIPTTIKTSNSKPGSCVYCVVAPPELYSRRTTVSIRFK